MKCPKCQAENPETRKFCRECGTKLIAICPKCGFSNPPEDKFCAECGESLSSIQTPITTSPPSPSQPTSFASGRYQVKKFLGEGGKKKVYLAHDTTLDRDVAFALIKTEKLDETGKTRIKREVQAMGKLGDHPNIVTVYDFGEHEGQPYIVLPLLPGGDVEGLIKKAPDHKLPLDKAIEIAESVCKGLEFAHAKGIIHRDIKPGNIWLSAEGTAKVGDFGLAVAVERSRLTKSGMMVGTVAYMPPEQAMGGKVTSKADLYSLGAMLYEMVTGRPPFVGDDSVSIIGQHINTPPVSPAWHRADLPPALDTLIMQLLEKDPEKRPESASVVLQALEAIEAGKIKKEPTKETTTKENPIYRRVFVGREPELKHLQSAFDGAMSGQGALMMVMGEPGIGKTALCEQLSTYVTLRGGKTLLGHCYEEGSLSLPYLAFVEAMRSYVLSREVKDLREELGTGATDVARIVSEISEKLKVKPRPQKDPEEERYRLMQAVTTFLTNAAAVQPLLIVLEDLHDADKGTLDMLTHVSRHFTGARLLMVGTYRDVEVDRTHPLSAALADLRRVATYGRVILRGLNADEVRRMLESITRESVPWGLAEAVHRQTEGNPLFVQEVVRFLAEERLITQKDGRWKPAKDTQLEMNIPEGLRDVIGKRLSLISKPCNQLLSIASVIGRDFHLDVLKKVAGFSDDELFKAIEEARKAAIIEERSSLGANVAYRFAHAFFRQTLYEEMIAPKRIRLHQQVARALEEIYAKKIEDHAAELAEHFSHSSDADDLKKAVGYGEMAAKKALVVYAYGEAIRLLEQTLKVQEILDPEDKAKRCDLLLDLCDILIIIPDTRRIIETEAPTAFSLAESIGDNTRTVRACLAAIFSLTMEQLDVSTPAATTWTERIDHYAKPETVERVFADTAVGSRKCSVGEKETGLALVNKAVETAHRLGNPNTVTYAVSTLMFWLRDTNQLPQREQLCEELWANRQHGSFMYNLTVYWYLASTSLSLGHRKRAEEVCVELQRKTERTGDFFTELLYTAVQATLATIDGNFEFAIEITNKLRMRGKELGVPLITSAFVSSGIQAQLYLGTSLEELPNKVHETGPEVIPLSCLVNALLGKAGEALKAINEFLNNRRSTALYDLNGFWVSTLLFEASLEIGDLPTVEILLKYISGTNICTPDFYPTCIPRHLGRAAVLQGKYDEAKKHYLEAIKVCMDMRFRPELALSRLQLAELLLEHFPPEKKEALEHLDFAIKEFREMKMQPSLERALRHKDILKA